MDWIYGIQLGFSRRVDFAERRLRGEIGFSAEVWELATPDQVGVRGRGGSGHHPPQRQVACAPSWFPLHGLPFLKHVRTSFFRTNLGNVSGRLSLFPSFSATFLPSSLKTVAIWEDCPSPPLFLTSLRLKLAWLEWYHWGTIPLARGLSCPHQRTSGAMGAASGEESRWGQKESQGCPEIRSVPVAARRTDF